MTTVIRLAVSDAGNWNGNSVEDRGRINIEEVDRFSYLCSMVKKDGGALIDMMARIPKYRSAFDSLFDVLTSIVHSPKLTLLLLHRHVVLYLYLQILW